MAEATVSFGRSAESIVEGGAGGLYHRAIFLMELDSAVYGVCEEFGYDTDPEAIELVRLGNEVRELLERVSLDEATARLTSHRVCSACGGDGKDYGLQEPERSQNPCEHCDGRGYDEKD